MEEKRTCLVLEGGALRGVYTSGIQGVLHKSGIGFDCVIGTSAGSMNGVNFLSGQPERSFYIDYHFARDKQFMGLRPLLKEGQIFSFSYMFGAVNDAFPYKLDAFLHSPTRFIAVASNAHTGEPTYLEHGPNSHLYDILKASSSMPMFSTPIEVDGQHYYDGGPSMPVAYQKALDEGFEKVVLILTREKGYRKSPFSKRACLAIRAKFRKWPAFAQMMLDSPRHYNTMMDEIDTLEAEGRIFVFRPSQKVTVARTEKDVKKLEDLFLLGRVDGAMKLPRLSDYLAK